MWFFSQKICPHRQVFPRLPASTYISACTSSIFLALSPNPRKLQLINVGIERVSAKCCQQHFCARVITRSILNDLCFTQDGTLLGSNGDVEQLSLVDAVLPDVVASRHALIASKVVKHESILKQEPGAEENYSRTNSVGHADAMEMDGPVNDVGGQKATLLRGHESEVGAVSLFYRFIHDISAGHIQV